MGLSPICSVSDINFLSARSQNIKLISNFSSCRRRRHTVPSAGGVRVIKFMHHGTLMGSLFDLKPSSLNAHFCIFTLLQNRTSNISYICYQTKMRLYLLTALLFATTALSEPTLSDKRTNQLTSPFLHRRSDMVITRDGRLISRQDVGIFLCPPFTSYCS